MAPKHNETRGAADVSATANKKRELALPLSLMTLLLEESYKGYCLGYYKGYSAEDEHCLFDAIAFVLSPCVCKVPEFVFHCFHCLYLLSFDDISITL